MNDSSVSEIPDENLFAKYTEHQESGDVDEWVRSLSLPELKSLNSDVHQRTLTYVRAWIEESPEKFAICVCEDILQIDGAKSAFFNDVPTDDPIRRRYAYLADLVLRKLRHEIHLTRTDDGFISAVAFIEQSFRESLRYLLPSKLGDTKTRDVLDFVFNQTDYDLGIAVMEFADLVYQGLPLYRQASDGSFTIIPMEDPDRIYLAQKSKYRDFSEYNSLPSWSNGLFYHEQHYSVLQTFFRGRYVGEEPDEAISALRGAYHAHLGIGKNQSSVRLIEDVQQLGAECVDRTDALPQIGATAPITPTVRPEPAHRLAEGLGSGGPIGAGAGSRRQPKGPQSQAEWEEFRSQYVKQNGTEQGIKKAAARHWKCSEDSISRRLQEFGQ